MSNISRF